ncbi:MAG: hypothetical protein GAK28_00161 [Luteibacter sp.]|uniref:hypothetical protein n=1 Tax=Luteibacter sp. TaxID=1886636 RepID=UPI00138120F3|nr:hypothetical protein [Luteibacter sp.]KAF1009523.1 MAG: hypothetical protein GAK28_00161 [Luteibacter sp.]
MKNIFAMVGMVMPKHSESKKGASLSHNSDPEILADFRRFHASKAPTAKDAHRAFGGIKLHK